MDYFLAHLPGFALLGGIALVLHLVWVLLFPYADCRYCKGRGRFSLGPFHRDCPGCNGGRRKQRFTARLLGRGNPRQSGPIVAPKTRKRNR